ncbi:MAG: transposase [Nanoarchaeota archaeon]|nr:transposase [Nanoarchaeota archaeon]
MPYKKFNNLWARRYYCGSTGHVSQKQVGRYIRTSILNFLET